MYFGISLQLLLLLMSYIKLENLWNVRCNKHVSQHDSLKQAVNNLCNAVITKLNASNLDGDFIKIVELSSGDVVKITKSLSNESISNGEIFFGLAFTFDKIYLNLNMLYVPMFLRLDEHHQIQYGLQKPENEITNLFHIGNPEWENNFELFFDKLIDQVEVFLNTPFSNRPDNKFAIGLAKAPVNVVHKFPL